MRFRPSIPHLKHMPVHINKDVPVKCGTSAHRSLLSIYDFPLINQQIDLLGQLEAERKSLLSLSTCRTLPF